MYITTSRQKEVILWLCNRTGVGMCVLIRLITIVEYVILPRMIIFSRRGLGKWLDGRD